MSDEIKKISSVYQVFNNTRHEPSTAKKPVKPMGQGDDLVDLSNEMKDQTSGLFGLSQFHDLFDYELSRSGRYDTDFSLINIKIGNFDDLNRVYGHFTASCLVTEIGKIIRQNIRSVDRGFHYGIDEFMVLLPNTPRSGAETMAAKLEGRIRSFSFLSVKGDSVEVAPLVGIASFPGDGTTAAALLSRACSNS